MEAKTRSIQTRGPNREKANKEEQPIASVLGIELERGRMMRPLGCNTIDTRCQDNVNLIVLNKRASDFTPMN